MPNLSHRMPRSRDTSTRQHDGLSVYLYKLGEYHKVQIDTKRSSLYRRHVFSLFKYTEAIVCVS
jgi:hypothetical protein